MHVTYGANNYNSQSGLLVWYEQELVTVGAYSRVRITRHATKRYAFVNMTEDAAAACVTAKRDMYTRAFATDSFDEAGVHSSLTVACKSEIASTVNEDGSRTVSISVNETDVHYAYAVGSYVNDPASYFSLENLRAYDDGIMPHKTMAGIASYSRTRNLSTEQDLVIMYEAVKKSGWTEFTRFATKVMTYVGMRQDAAENCAKAKMSQYTRLYSYIDSSNQSRNKTRVGIGASIDLRRNGIMWEVSICVNETDVKTASNDTNPSELFAEENGRSYEDSGDLELESVVLDVPTVGSPTVTATATAASHIPGKTLGDCTFEYRVGSEVDWNTASVEWTGSTGILSLPVTEEDIFCRLTCASTESETILAE